MDEKLIVFKTQTKKWNVYTKKTLVVKQIGYFFKHFEKLYLMCENSMNPGFSQSKQYYKRSISLYEQEEVSISYFTPM